jgi:hypothetical protein
VPHLGFLQIILGDEPALPPYQQIYRRLIRKAVADASTVALAEIEEKGRERGLDDSMGRMVVLAEADRAQDRLSAAQVEAIVEGTDEVLDFLAADAFESHPSPPAVADTSAWEIQVRFDCVGGRGPIDDAAASIVAFALRQSGLEAASQRRGEKPSADVKDGALAIQLICYASHPSDAVRRYTVRKLTLGGGASQARHLVIDYGVAPPGPSIAGNAGARDTFAGDLATLCRLAAQHAVTVGHSPGSTPS